MLWVMSCTHYNLSTNICIYMYIYLTVQHTHTHINIHIYNASIIYIYIYMYTCARVFDLMFVFSNPARSLSRCRVS